MATLPSNLTELLGKHDEAERRRVLARLTPHERRMLAMTMDGMLGSPYGMYRYDPVGFVQDVLHETLWSKQREILQSVRDHKRTAVPACHAPGKSHIAARAVAWWVTVHAPGTALAITTATTFRQVRTILWPHIRRVHTRHNLPGEVLTTEWKIGSDIGAFGFSAADNDEAAVQGVHVPHLLIVVDEAGGISHQLGQAFEALMTGSHTRLLTIGNPATDHANSWFEKCCTSELYNVIPIDVFSTPNFTGEDAGICRACPPGIREHRVNTHLVDPEWVREVTLEFGEDSAFVEARVNARFPSHVANRVIPVTWIEEAVHNTEAVAGDKISLGVDVASDGGDEFVIARADGFKVQVVFRSAGSANENAVDVAGKILEHIRIAEADREARNIKARVRVKIDAVGVGWGVVSMLQRWRDEGKHDADIVGVNVGERASAPARFANQRAELWWNGRTLLQPIERVGGGTDQQMSLPGADRLLVAQLAGPMYKTDSAGRIVIEKKSEMKKRGLSSPDQAEAVLLAIFEPPGRGEAPLVAPIGLGQDNPWTL